MIECLFKHAPGNYSEIFRNGGICGKKKINQRTSVPSVRLKGKSQGESQRIHQRSDSHCTDRFYTWFYRGCVISRHPGGIPGRICACDPGNDLFFHGSRIIYDAHGRACGRQYASHEEIRLYYNYRFYSGLYYHNI